MYVDVPPDVDELIGQLTSERLLKLIGTSVDADDQGYVHWDKLRHLDPPGDLSHKEWWLVIKWGRRSLLRSIPLQDAEGRPFVYSVPDVVFRSLHYVDQRCSGEIAMPGVVTTDDQARKHYLVNSLMEEAIRSSQLEGATTSRRVAKELLRSGREPQDRSERMILNNFRAIQYMREKIGDELTPQAVLELQRIITEGTLDDATGAGRLQTPDDERVAVFDSGDQSLLHSPPPAEQLPARLQALCDFANDGDDHERFVHPVIRALLLHLWLAYDHPFEDGNGRTARALFYWYLRTRGYWLVEYLSISRILREAPAQYGESFLLTETDERDATYFLIYQLQVIERAIGELRSYLQRKVTEARDFEQMTKGSSEFNHRQVALLGNAIRSPDQIYSYRSHSVSHAVTSETARADLLALFEEGLLVRRTIGQRYLFSPAPDLAKRLRERGGT